MAETTSRQNVFIRSLEGIGDILVFETQRKSKNKAVIDGLGKIKTILETFFALRETSPERFDELMADSDFLRISRTDPKEAGARLLLFPERQLVSFTVALQQIRRVHEQAIISKNDEISRQATVHLVWILQHLTKQTGNEIFVKQLLQSLYEVTDAAIRDNDRSMYSAAINWYFASVFRSEIRLEYVETLTDHFRNTVQQIIAKDQWQLYQAVVEALVHGFMLPVNTTHALWEYEHLWITDETFRREVRARGLPSRSDTLTRTAGAIASLEEYESWLKALREFDAALDPYLPAHFKSKKEKAIVGAQKYAADVFKFNALREAVMALGAFMVREGRAKYIRHLWEFKQPADAEAVWGGPDVNPATLDEHVAFYFAKGYFERSELTWGDHRGTRMYYQRYFLLRLARLLEPTVAVDGKYPTLQAFNLPAFSVNLLSNLESSVDELMKQIAPLRTDEQFLEAVGLTSSKIADTFGKVVPAFLQILKEKSKARLDEIKRAKAMDREKVIAFQDEAFSAFEESLVLRRLLHHFGLVNDLSQQPLPAHAPEIQFAIRNLDDKAAFFLEWHVHYGHWGQNYGQSLALSEDNRIVHDLMQAAKDQGRTLQQALTHFPKGGDPFLLCGHMTVLDSFERAEGFVSRWTPESSPLPLPNFEGWFTWHGRRIPVFVCHMEEGKIALLDAKKLVTFTIYAPGFGSEPPESRRGYLIILVRAYSEDAGLMDGILNRPPDWLAEKGDRAAQASYLLDKVLVEITERFELKLVEEPSIELVRISSSASSL
jgi:hypothetical protein